MVEKAEETVVELSNQLNILTVGRMRKQKGYEIAIETAKILKEKNLKFKWYAIGKGKDERKLKQLVYKYNLNNYFIFIRQKENPYTYMKACDIYVQLSRHEGYGITIIEAKALFKPIIASDIQPFKEQIINEKNGYLVKLDAESFADKIIELFNDGSKVDKVTKNLINDPIDFSSEIQKLENLL